MEGYKNKKSDSIKHSVRIFLALGLSSASQVIIQIVTAYLFGSGKETDAFFVAFIIPVILFGAINNSLKVSLVPMFTHLLEEKGREALWQVSGTLLMGITFFLTLFAILTSFISPYIINLMAPGLEEETWVIAVNIFRILSFSVIFAGVIAIWTSIQNIYSRFFVPASSNFIRAVFIIIIVMISYKSLSIQALAVGFVTAGLFQCLILLPGLRKEGYCFRGHLSFNDPNMKLFFGLTVLPFLCHLLRQGGTIVDRFLASFLPTGSLSALAYSYTFTMGIIMLVSNGLSSVSLPELSKHVIQGKIAEMKEVLKLNLKLASVITFPLTVLLIILGKPVIKLLYERGAFDAAATELTASLLFLYAIGIFFFSVVPVMLGVFYAFKDTYTPFIHLLFVFIVNIVLAVLLTKVMSVHGLSLAFSLAGIFSFGRVSMMLSKRHGTVLDRTILIFWCKTLVSSLIMGIAIWFFLTWNSASPSYKTMIGNIKLIIFSLCIGVVTFGLSAYILKLEGRRFIVKAIANKFDDYRNIM